MNESLKAKIRENAETYPSLEKLVLNTIVTHKVPVPIKHKDVAVYTPPTHDITVYLCQKWDISKSCYRATENEALSRQQSTSEPSSYTIAYIQFLKSISLLGTIHALLFFDLKVFVQVFSNDYTDIYIQQFIEKLITDPITYEKNEKSFFYEILKFAYIYCYRTGLKKYLGPIKKKLNENIKLNRSIKSDFKFIITDDATLDPIFMKSCILSTFANESEFLNSFYKIYINKQCPNKKMTDLFFNRLTTDIKAIDSAYLVDFLRNVFLYNTVLCKLVSLNEILSVPISILEKLKFQEKYIAVVFEFYHAMLLKDGLSIEIYETVLGILKQHSIHFREYYKVLFYLQDSITDFCMILKENADSYNTVSCLITNLSKLIQTNNQNLLAEHTLNLIKTNLECIQMIKNEFIIQLSDKFIGMLSILLVNVMKTLASKDLENENCKQLIFSYIAREEVFFREVLSAFTLVVYCNENNGNTAKKKKMCCARNTRDPKILKFIEKIRELEHIINQKRRYYNIDHDIILLKDKSFIINT